MNRPAVHKRILCCICCLIMAIGAVSSGSLPFLRPPLVEAAYAEEAGREAESLEKEEESLRADAREAERLQEEMLTQVQALNEELAQLSTDMNALSIQIEGTEEQLSALHEQLIQAEESREQQYADMQLRIQYMYENQDAGLIQLILSGGTLAEMLSRMEYVTALTDYDRQKLEQLQETEQLIASAETELADTKEQLELQQSEYREKQQEITERIAGCQQEIAGYADAILRLNAQADELADAAVARRTLMEELMEAEKEETAAVQTESVSAQKSSESQEPSAPAESLPVMSSEPETTATGTNAPQSPEDEKNGESGNGGEYAVGDVELLAALIKSEAANQPREGKLAIANVVLNRVNSASFPDTVLEVIYQPNQFTPVSTGVFAGYLAAGVEEEFYELARLALSGENVVPQALYFRRAASTVPDDGIVIGNHVFY